MMIVTPAMSSSIPTDDQGRSPFRAMVESKLFAHLEDTLAPNVQFRSPAVFQPYEGRPAVGFLLRVVADVLGPEIAYQWQVREGDREVLLFTTRVGGREVEGVDLLRYDGDGRVSELVVMIRPLSALEAVRDAVGERLASARGSAGS
jgi:hypothetical protein